MFYGDTIRPMVDVRDVVKRFPAGNEEITVLRGISFTVAPGEFVSIVGPSGNGKSTLLNMISGIDRPSDGEVVVAGKPVNHMTEDQLARWRGENLGIIFQFFQMLPALTLLNNVVLPMELAGKFRPKERHDRAIQLLEMVGLGDQADKLPSQVSGGQQQRAAIARALANDPPLLIADEPTGNLDSVAAHSIFELFERLAQEGKTLVMVTHDQELARRAPRTIEIRDGRVTRDDNQADGRISEWANQRMAIADFR